MSVIDNALQTLFKLGIEVKKVWENASPSSNFAAQNVAVNIAGADMILVDHIRMAGVAEEGAPAPCAIVGHITSGSVSFIPYAGSMCWRTVAWNSTSQIAFGDCVRLTTYAVSGSQEKINNILVPKTIYTIKLLGGVIHRIKTLAASLHLCSEGRCWHECIR